MTPSPTTSATKEEKGVNKKMKKEKKMNRDHNNHNHNHKKSSSMSSSLVKTEGKVLSGTPVDFLYKTMLERDPRKRKVKPVDHKNFESLELLDDLSSDDEEYIPKGGGEDDDVDLDEDGSGEDDNDDNDDDEDDEDESSEDDNNLAMLISPSSSKAQVTQKSTKFERSISERSDKILTSPKKSDLSSKVNSIRICSVCCGDTSLDSDEIVECDSCSITVHENCYGVSGDESDNDSVHSTLSSASTEPWFCDACKAHVRNPTCDLCPNSGGIFKQTDAGRWVHIVCALYINGVAFTDTIHLTGITLFEFAYDRWGAKPCILCEDERFARTGVTISCDAGLCRTFFHVTCAQREGLLQEVQEIESETEIVDPFVAHCKMHAVEKGIVKSKKRNFLSLQSRMKFKSSAMTSLPARTLKKLEKARDKWRRHYNHILKPPAKQEDPEIFHNFLPPHTPATKLPRLLTTSPKAVKALVKKAELMGFTPESTLMIQDAIDIRRKWHVPPAFSIEFVSYYIDRGSRINNMKKKILELQSQGDSLKKEEADITKTMNDQVIPQHDDLKKKSLELKSKARNIWTKLNEIRSLGRSDIKDTVKMPSLFETPVRDRKISDSHTTSSSIHPTKRKLSFSGRLSLSHEFKLKECTTCGGKKDQHFLALCDSCRLHYHLYCLDPPLTRMPKKTRFGGWQCSDCTDKQREVQKKQYNPLLADEEDSVDESSARKRTRRGPNKYLPDADTSRPSIAQTTVTKRRGRPPLTEKQKQLRLLARKRKEEQMKRQDTTLMISLDESQSPGSIVKGISSPKKVQRSPPLEKECCRCQKTSSTLELVR